MTPQSRDFVEQNRGKVVVNHRGRLREGMNCNLVPHHSHWGGFKAVAEDGKVVGDAPFNLDPHPSPLIDGIGDAVQSTTRTTNLDTQGTATTIIGPIDGRTAHGCDPVERPL